jgi:hypothetical protein
MARFADAARLRQKWRRALSLPADDEDIVLKKSPAGNKWAAARVFMKEAVAARPSLYASAEISE